MILFSQYIYEKLHISWRRNIVGQGIVFSILKDGIRQSFNPTDTEIYGGSGRKTDILK